MLALTMPMTNWQLHIFYDSFTNKVIIRLHYTILGEVVCTQRFEFQISTFCTLLFFFALRRIFLQMLLILMFS